MTQYSSVSIPGDDLPLSTHHRRELIVDSAIDVEVARERGYTTVGRPESSLKDGHGRDTREQLSAMGFPSWSIRESYYFPGLHIPQYTPTGQRYAGQWKPSRAVPSKDGKPQRYAAAKGSSRLDVHPRWSADRGAEDPALLPAIKDPSMRLLITEGVKKADSLTSRGEVTVALAGVFNWRNVHGALGDWEDVRIKDRECVIVFDSDAITKVAVAQAMQRLGAWLKHKGASKVLYCVTPPAVGGSAVKGVDDYFAAGGTMRDLEKSFSPSPPRVTSLEDRFTDTRLAEALAAELLDGYYAWASGMGWMQWDGKRWAECSEVAVLEGVRCWARDHFADAADKMRKPGADQSLTIDVDGWRKVLGASKQEAILKLSRGIVEKRAEAFDSDPDILNTPSGIVNLMTGELLPHDPDALCTKMTSGSYRPGFEHPDWTTAMNVLPVCTMTWMQTRLGQAITGHTTPEGSVPILKGGGENGKSLLVTDGILPAVGGYGSVASAKLMEKGQHSTEQASLRGQRLVMMEELTEGRSIDVTGLKRIADVGRIRAREVYKNHVEFVASHSLFATTNYTPVINEVDHGTWRRLWLVVFPYTFVKPGLPLNGPNQLRGDPTLKRRLARNATGQHDAIVTWLVEGAMRWYANQADIERAIREGEEPPATVMYPPAQVEEDTAKWRMEADRIMGFWHARLEPAEDSFVVMRELVEAFNAWLREGGHAHWAQDTFRSRFLDHVTTKAARVEAAGRKRTASIVDRIAREPGRQHLDLRTQEDLVRGLRWKAV